MSRKDEAVVRDLLPDEVAIEDYFASKGKVLPSWVKTAVRNYWSRVPNEHFTILAIRAVRKHLMEMRRAAPEELVSLFVRLVSIHQLIENLPVNSNGHRLMSDEATKAWVAIFKQLSNLEQKYKLNLIFNVSEEIPDLEEWEKLLD